MVSQRTSFAFDGSLFVQPGRSLHQGPEDRDHGHDAVPGVHQVQRVVERLGPSSRGCEGNIPPDPRKDGLQDDFRLRSRNRQWHVKDTRSEVGKGAGVVGGIDDRHGS